jgi:hypothetical protein
MLPNQGLRLSDGFALSQQMNFAFIMQNKGDGIPTRKPKLLRIVAGITTRFPFVNLATFVIMDKII